MSGLGAATALVVAASAHARKFEVERKRKKAVRDFIRKQKRKKRLEKVKLHLAKKDLDILSELDTLIHTNQLDGSDYSCPECQNKMSKIQIQKHEANYCLLCKSLWFDNGILKVFTGFDKDCPSDDKASRDSKYPCPVCRDQMREYVFLVPHNLLVDQCVQGHGVYLENGEMERALILETEE